MHHVFYILKEFLKKSLFIKNDYLILEIYIDADYVSQLLIKINI